MNQAITNRDDSLAELDRLAELTEDVLRRCRAKGANEVDVGVGVDVGLVWPPLMTASVATRGHVGRCRWRERDGLHCG